MLPRVASDARGQPRSLKIERDRTGRGSSFSVYLETFYYKTERDRSVFLRSIMASFVAVAGCTTTHLRVIITYGVSKMRFVDLRLAMLTCDWLMPGRRGDSRCLLACLAVRRDRGEPWLSCHATVPRFPFARTDRSSTRKCLHRFASAGTELDREAQRGSLDRRAQLRGRGT